MAATIIYFSGTHLFYLLTFPPVYLSAHLNRRLLLLHQAQDIIIGPISNIYAENRKTSVSWSFSAWAVY